jgi:hypothetical protein
MMEVNGQKNPSRALEQAVAALQKKSPLPSGRGSVCRRLVNSILRAVMSKSR